MRVVSSADDVDAFEGRPLVQIGRIEIAAGGAGEARVQMYVDRELHVGLCVGGDGRQYNAWWVMGLWREGRSVPSSEKKLRNAYLASRSSILEGVLGAIVRTLFEKNGQFELLKPIRDVKTTIYNFYIKLRK